MVIIAAALLALVLAICTDTIYAALLWPDECRERRRKLRGWPYNK